MELSKKAREKLASAFTHLLHTCKESFREEEKTRSSLYLCQASCLAILLARYSTNCYLIVPVAEVRVCWLVGLKTG